MSLDKIARFLDRALGVEGEHAAFYVGEQNGVYVPSRRPIERLGLALEAAPDLLTQVRERRLDALFLHRPWGMTSEQREQLIAEEIGVLAYHLAFDERLTTGFNPHLAEAFGLRGLEVLGHKQGRPLGMLGRLPEATNFSRAAGTLRQLLGGLEQEVSPSAMEQLVTRMAVVGAMNDALVREAHARGADVYVTGQWRKPAAAAVRETGIGVLLTGHRRMEEWGLRTLAWWLGEGLPVATRLL